VKTPDPKHDDAHHDARRDDTRHDDERRAGPTNKVSDQPVELQSGDKLLNKVQVDRDDHGRSVLGDTSGTGTRPEDPNLKETPTGASRFLPRDRELNDDEQEVYDDVNAAFAALEQQMIRIKPGRCFALAMTHLENAHMWATKEIMN
jgi:hypothetical protein